MGEPKSEGLRKKLQRAGRTQQEETADRPPDVTQGRGEERGATETKVPIAPVGVSISL